MGTVSAGEAVVTTPVLSKCYIPPEHHIFIQKAM